MNRTMASLGIAILAMSQSIAAQKSKDCYAHAKSQMELTNCAFADEKAADIELNKTYQQILKKYSDQPEFLEKLKKAQRIWIQFREVELDMEYPLKPEMYGSAHPMCVASDRSYLTLERTKQLRKWLRGVKEGDVCSGSAKTPEELK